MREEIKNYQRRQKFFAAIFISFFILNLFIINKTLATKPDYVATRTEQSYPGIIRLEAGKGFTFWVKFKNVGLKNWSSVSVALKTENGAKSFFAHSTWMNNYTPYVVKYGVPVNTIGTFQFAIQAPLVNGTYWEKFQLHYNDQKIPGGDIEIGMQVYGGQLSSITTQPSNINVINNQTPTNNNNHYWQIIPNDYTIREEIKIIEPKIRVGLMFENSQKPHVNLPYKIKTRNNEAYQVRLLDTKDLLLTQTQGELTEIDFDFASKRYFINVAGKRIASTDSPIGFFPIDPNKQIIFKIDSWYRGPFWGIQCNDNEYRGTIEVKYNPNTDRLWLINELPIEDYMKGVAEVQDSYPEQALKAQKIAARTYAYTRILIPKYTNISDADLPLIDLRATQADQVYRGYLWELRTPNIKKAAEETSGMVALHNNTPILAYYFARTDGKTRSGHESGMTREPMPYLISVNDPPGQGKTLLGHGVGMPQQSMKVAADQGASFTQILRYYYRGIDIKKIW